MRDLRWMTALAVLLCPLLAACGAAKFHSAPPSRSEVRRSLQGSPPALAQLHDQANRLLPGGVTAFNARLRALRGHPVVVNKWASWCGPCQSEFPTFQRAAVKYGRQVAFVGLDGNDHDGSASSFLRRFPVTYPSYVDPRSAIAGTIGAASYFPMTVYITPSGHRVFEHAGPYATEASLEHDIRFYLLK
ncbi:MAG: TlpA family protein disulfide reductase [Solirubrobacteraceae bacterium]